MAGKKGSRSSKTAHVLNLLSGTRDPVIRSGSGQTEKG